MKNKEGEKKGKEKEFIGVVFKCCNVYSRIYLNQDKTAFVGWCPKCAAKLSVRVSPEGSPDRFFITD